MLEEPDYGQRVVENAKALAQALDSVDEPILAFSHLSHVYAIGSSIYTTFVFRLAETPQGDERIRWMNHEIARADSPFADPATYPVRRGFDRYYGVIWGSRTAFRIGVVITLITLTIASGYLMLYLWISL